VLKELAEALSQQYLLTNQNITEGKNPHIKFSENGGFTLDLKLVDPIPRFRQSNPTEPCI
jgi:hypothetical protein